MCIGPQDFEGLWIESLLSCVKFFPLLAAFYIVTPCKNQFIETLKHLKIHKKINVLSDEEVLDSHLHKEEGWYKQQLIKLESFKICSSRFVACLSSDTLLLQTLDHKTLFSSQGLPVLFYCQGEQASKHYCYEQCRLENIEKIFQVKLERARSFTNFILDFTIWDTEILKQLKTHLIQLYGPEVFKIIGPGKCDTLAKKTSFGEWTLYAAFVLDIIQAKNIEVKGFNEDYFFQVHSQKDLLRFNYQSKIVHFVDKNIDIQGIKSDLKRYCKISS